MLRRRAVSSLRIRRRDGSLGCSGAFTEQSLAKSSQPPRRVLDEWVRLRQRHLWNQIGNGFARPVLDAGSVREGRTDGSTTCALSRSRAAVELSSGPVPEQLWSPRRLNVLIRECHFRSYLEIGSSKLRRSSTFIRDGAAVSIESTVRRGALAARCQLRRDDQRRVLSNDSPVQAIQYRVPRRTAHVRTDVSRHDQHVRAPHQRCHRDR